MDEKTLLGSYSSSFDILDEVTDLVFHGYRNGFDLTNSSRTASRSSKRWKRLNRIAPQGGLDEDYD
jgi:hypothetical protein